MMRSEIPGDFSSWRRQSRQLIQARLHPEKILWRKAAPRGELALDEGLGESFAVQSQDLPSFSVPREFLQKAELVFYHRSEKKWALLYRLLWRLVHEAQTLLSDTVDEDVAAFLDMEHQVRRDAHKMKAFVRFRKLLSQDGSEQYIAWHDPDHPLLPYVVSFFKDRFASMNWTLLTPDASAHWNGQDIVWGRGCAQHEAPHSDQLEDLWACYYAAIFNPARVKIKAMKAEMPARYWKSMPETRQIQRLLAESDDRVAAMIAKSPRDAAAFVPETKDPGQLRAAAANCTACSLCHAATQTVFGEGPAQARVMIVGEQPGDQEDQQGRPFVGPAGQLLDEALQQAGINRKSVYMTNAVKHFKFSWQGSRRLHEKPGPRDVAACKPWLLAEQQMVQPEVIVCLGLTAALSVFGRSFVLKDVRGLVQASRLAPRTLVTWHPAHILRLPESEERERAFQQLVADLSQIGQEYRTPSISAN